MSIKRTMAAAAAAFALSIPVYTAALSDPVNEAAPEGARAPSTFTLIARGVGGFGMRGGGFAMRGGGLGRMGGMGPRFAAGPRVGGRFMGTRTFANRRAAFFPGRRAAFFHGRRVVFFHGRRGFFRHGRFFPLIGVGIIADGGGSCYWNCRAAGFGPGYCSVYALDFC